MTCRSGQKDRRGQLWETLWAQPIYDLIGAAIPRYDVLPEGRNGTVTANGKSYQWGSWGDLLEPREGTQTLATYADQFYKGKAAATWHALGKGHVAYIGVDSLSGEFEADVLKMVYEKAGVKTQSLPLDFMIDWRDGFWVGDEFHRQRREPAGGGEGDHREREGSPRWRHDLEIRARVVSRTTSVVSTRASECEPLSDWNAR